MMELKKFLVACFVKLWGRLVGRDSWFPFFQIVSLVGSLAVDVKTDFLLLQVAHDRVEGGKSLHY